MSRATPTNPLPPRDLAPVPLIPQIRNPHPSIRALRDHLDSLPVAKAHRRRALLIAHTLVAESLRRGWAVSGAWDGESSHRYDRDDPTAGAPDLFTIDAGHHPVAIRIRMKLTRVRHVPDPNAKRWGSTRKWDYVPTDTLRVEVRPHTWKVHFYDDSTRKSVDQKLTNILWRVQQISDEIVAEREHRRREDAERARTKAAFDARVSEHATYTTWVEALDEVRRRFKHHEALADAIDSLEDGYFENSPVDRERVAQFVRWSRAHLAAAHAQILSAIPQGELPSIDYAAWKTEPQ